jgi:hypothetical protein
MEDTNHRGVMIMRRVLSQLKRLMVAIVDNFVWAILLVVTILVIIGTLLGQALTTYNTVIVAEAPARTEDRATTLALLVLVGLLLAILRHKWLKLYGLLELVAGVTATLGLFGRSGSSALANLVALLAATYLIARGFSDYLDDDLRKSDERKEDRKRSAEDLIKLEAQLAEMKRRLDEHGPRLNKKPEGPE